MVGVRVAVILLCLAAVKIMDQEILRCPPCW